MKLVTKRTLIEGLVTAWERQFGRDPEKPRCKTILTALRSLDLGRATEFQVARIIGNGSWTRLRCIECGQDCAEAFHFGDSTEALDPPVYVCRDCLQTAVSEYLETSFSPPLPSPRFLDLCLKEA